MVSYRIWCLLALAFTGCVAKIDHVALRPIKLSNAANYLANTNTGLLVFAVETGANIEKIVCSGPESFTLGGDFLNKGSVVAVPLKPGMYTIDEIQIETRSKKIVDKGVMAHYDLSDDEENPMQFEVVEGEINYLGHLTFVKAHFDWRKFFFVGHIDFTNRSSYMYTYLQKKSPGLLNSYPIRHIGYGDDGFFDEIKRLEEISERGEK